MARQRVWPRSAADALGMGFMALAVPGAYLFELCLVLPARYPEPCLALSLHRLLCTFLLFSVLANYLLVCLVDTRARGLYHPAARLCAACDLLVPPRVWHCEECGHCILKRDHHCVLTGCCVGLHNYRYFFCLLLHLTVSTLYGSALNLWYLSRLTPWSFAGLVQLLLPGLAFILFPESSNIQAQRIFCLVSVGMAVLSTVVFVIYLRNLLAGVTMAERRKKLNPYPERGVIENLRQALGQRWHLVALCPFLPSPIPQEDDLSTTFLDKCID